MEKRGGRGDLCEENRRIQALNRLLDALRAMIGRLSDQAQGILTAVKRRQRPSGAPQAPSSPEPALQAGTAALQRRLRPMIFPILRPQALFKSFYNCFRFRSALLPQGLSS